MNIKNVVFDHCSKCVYAERCYAGGNPRFLEPACFESPVTAEEEQNS